MVYTGLMPGPITETIPDAIDIESVVVRLDNVLHALATINERMDRIETLIDRFLPLLERFEKASTVNGFLAQRKAMKG